MSFDNKLKKSYLQFMLCINVKGSSLCEENKEQFWKIELSDT